MVASASTKVVWIVGAGFSRPLGAPLLPDLFSESMASEIRLRFPNLPELYGPEATDLREFKRTGDPDRRRIWADAEEFIEALDIASLTPDPPAAARTRELHAQLRAQPGSKLLPLPELRDLARRMIAAECCAFLHGAITAGERWDPYRDWATKLGEDDTVITFNYDRVVETLRLECMRVFVPRDDRGEYASAKLGKVLKLHGSVDWRREETPDGVQFHREDDPIFALRCSGPKIAIATPGPTKRAASIELHELWDLAIDAIKAAGAVVFVGYRFPETDAEARSRLLAAIEANDTPTLALHVVLGEPGFHSNRLSHMLYWMSRRAGRLDASAGARPEPGFMKSANISDAIRNHEKLFTVRVHPLWAQDFLTVWSRDRLFIG